MFWDNTYDKHITTIEDIRKNYKNGALYTSKYRLIITPPPSVNYGDITEKLVVLAKTASLPEHKIGTEEIKLKGRPVLIKKQLELGSTYTVGVYEDSDMKIRKVLDNWIDMGDRLGVGGNEFYNDGNIKIYQLDGNNNAIYGVEFYDVFLTSLGSITFDGSSAGEVVSYDLTFAYSGWDILNV